VAWFGASCEKGYCELIDTRTIPATECEADADCVTSGSLSCCANCSPDANSAIGINVNANLSGLQCGGLLPCDACDPPPEARFKAQCRNGRCIAVEVGDPI
jgi:hypothetical protein